MITPTEKQIENAIAMGWEYLGDGIFCKEDVMGYYTKTGFVKE